MDKSSRHFPALDCQRPEDDEALERLLADLDDFSPTAVEERAEGVRVFFGTPAGRDQAAAFLRARHPATAAQPADVPDEAWAERSQAGLPPIRVGRIVVSSSPLPASGDDVAIVIRPSMGFGTGHHASTRLCLALLQRAPVAGAAALDAGTGSGVLAIAAARLGARAVLAVDADEDALTAARESVALNEGVGAVELRHLDLTRGLETLPRRFDLITANLTAAFLERHAALLAGHLAPDGRIIASGIQTDEAHGVEQAFEAAGLAVIDRLVEQDWVGLLLG